MNNSEIVSIKKDPVDIHKVIVKLQSRISELKECQGAKPRPHFSVIQTGFCTAISVSIAGLHVKHKDHIHDITHIPIGHKIPKQIKKAVERDVNEFVEEYYARQEARSNEESTPIR